MASGFFPPAHGKGQSSVGDGMKADFTPGSGFADFVSGDKALDRVKDDAELFVVFRFERVNPAGQVAIGVHEAAQLDKGAHDGDVDLDGAGGAEDAGKHGDALLGKGIRGGTAKPAATRYHRL
jgi:hypothetical protein